MKYDKFCEECGGTIEYKRRLLTIVGRCKRCKKEIVYSLPKEEIVRKLREIIENEIWAAQRELYKKEIFESEIINLEGEILDLSIPKEANFEIGDTVGYKIKDTGNREIKILGTVIYTNIKSGMISILIERDVKNEIEQIYKEKRKLYILEVEPLVSLKKQLELLEKIEKNEIKNEIPLQLFFEEKKLPELKRSKTPKNYKTVDGEKDLDDSQKEVLNFAISLEEGELLLVIGPPGCGKTEVIKKIANEYVNDGKKVLITSHTNTAVDEAIEGLPLDKTVRVGRPEKIRKEIKDYMIGCKLMEKAGEKLRDLEEKIEELSRRREELAKRLEEKNEEYKTLSRELAELISKRKELLNAEVKKVLFEEPERKGIIVGSTLVKSQLPPLKDLNFDVVIIDECSQASITLALLAMIKAKKFILVGDDKQLLPIFKEIREIEKCEELSAFSFLLKKYKHRKSMLKIHYRSNDSIIGFSAKYIYNGEITPHESCKNKILKIEKDYPRKEFEILKDKSVVFVHVSSEERIKSDGHLYRGTRSNEKEASVVAEIAKMLISDEIKIKKEDNTEIKKEDIGIITPYRGQRKLLKEKIEGIEIETVDGFQGREKDIIIFSVTATTKFEFVSHLNRLNVALTRPRLKLIVVGNGKAILKEGKNSLLKKFLEYVDEKGGIYDWESKKWMKMHELINKDS